MTVAVAAKRWLETRVKTGRNEKGQRMSAVRVEKYLKPYMGHLLIAKVTRSHLREYRIWLERRCRKPATVGHILGDARGLLYWCVEAGILEQAPIPRRLMPRIPETPPDRLTDDQVDNLMQLPEPYLWVVRFALATGLRWGELCRSQARDIQDGSIVVGRTKSGKVRRVPLAPDILEESKSRVGRLVPFAEGSPGSFSKAVRRRTGIDGFHVHQMRHTFACRWLERGGSLAALQEMLGHASITTTQRYARLSHDMLKREVMRVSQV
jgi:integrase